ncbi:aminotransferase class I/II-fold pyridoxal phosphate-dependent enzyme [Candidatus Pacearchaeota archaeon]|nr:aminotransferase class I/II-fold pyridoxal phosphate-dependent enzyme [Candidatus Pacearchaeota archaeon]
MIPWAKPSLFGNEEEFLVDAIKSSWISDGPYVSKFEEEFSQLMEVKNTITTSNGTTALTLALLGLGINPGDEVIVPGFCFVAPGNTVIQIGAKPVYADVDIESWCIDPKSIKKLINSKTKAIIPVHNYGNMCNMEEIMEIAKENNLYVIEDAAEAAFSKYNDKFAGTLGDIGCFSFQATKTITMGEGGAVVTDNSVFNKKMRKFRNHGMTSTKYMHDAIGYNFRLTNIQAALGCSQLKNLNEILFNKKRIYDSYLKNLGNLDGISFQKITPNSDPLIWAVAIKIEPSKFKSYRDFLMKELSKRGIETRPGFYPFSKMSFYNAPSLPVSESISKDIIVLPSFVSLKEKEIDYISDNIKSLIKN